MVDRVKCISCGAESFAGPNIYCPGCFGRLKAAHDKLLAENEKLHEELVRMSEELKTADYLLENRTAVLRAIPECPEHGPQCVPHAIEWVEEAKAKLAFMESG